MAFRKKSTGLDKCTGYFYNGREVVLTKMPDNNPVKRVYAKGWYPEQKRIECATVYAVTRNLDMVSQLTGVPVNHLKNFQVQPWWDNIVSMTIKQKNEELDGKITQALDQGLDLLLDRIQNGELFSDRKTGITRRVPMAAKTMILATDVLFDKRQLLRGEATTRSDSITPEQKLMALKDQFEKLAKSKGINTHAPIEATSVSEVIEDAVVLSDVSTPMGPVLRTEGDSDGMVSGLSDDEGTGSDQSGIQGQS